METDISNLLRLEVWDVVVSQDVFQSFYREPPKTGTPIVGNAHICFGVWDGLSKT